MITLHPLTDFKNLPKYTGLHDMLPKKDRAHSYQVFKLDDEGRFVGVFSIQDLKRNKECVARLYIVPKYRRKWATRRILKQLADLCFNAGYDTIIASSNNASMERIMSQFYGARQYDRDRTLKWYFLNREMRHGKK